MDRMQTTRTQAWLDAFRERCRAAGIRTTHQRTEIYRELATCDAHPDARTILRRVRKRVPAVSFDTVYRTLRTLEARGLIKRVGTPLERFRFDADLTKHHHFVCGRCGAIRDFRSAACDALSAPDIARKLGVAETVHVEARGTCHACRNHKPPNR